jgi:hypothetical protein
MHILTFTLTRREQKNTGEEKLNENIQIFRFGTDGESRWVSIVINGDYVNGGRFEKLPPKKKKKTFEHPNSKSIIKSKSYGGWNGDLLYPSNVLSCQDRHVVLVNSPLR